MKPSLRIEEIAHGSAKDSPYRHFDPTIMVGAILQYLDERVGAEPSRVSRLLVDRVRARRYSDHDLEAICGLADACLDAERVGDDSVFGSMIAFYDGHARHESGGVRDTMLRFRDRLARVRSFLDAQR